MRYDVKNTLNEFNSLMNDIRKNIPEEYSAFIEQKAVLTKDGKLPSKQKWLILLAVSVIAKCPICIPKAVQHCLEAGWNKPEMLEACMISVLVGGSSTMTYVTLVDKAIDELKK
ncbi:MAG: carboxymuconolactone decarboxylase family protein [Candidatus Omnitrophica bacterium]|nr:carboxymuconolactone decarboxylase family protein [Candidatus Omnitrophota bacterium]MDD5081176.1 carboxymuconolactone decarboxylase family protein [Candidatus Omnitrophota bacterium]MDD5441043.1 carboxymuconolactone decarboxylase family protein [Candidatus Omnitrophota bacterium]